LDPLVERASDDLRKTLVPPFPEAEGDLRRLDVEITSIEEAREKDR
jgi:hypothetical protein